MANGDNRADPLLYGAVILGIAVTGGALWLVLPATATAIGTAVRIAQGAVPLPASLASWVMPTAALGLAATGATGAIFVTYRVVKEASKDPYPWLSPVLGVVSGFVGGLTRELFPGSRIPKVAFGGVLAALTVAAGILWRQRTLGSRLLSGLLFLLPLLLVLIGAADWSSGISSAMSNIETQTWLALALLAGTLLATLGLAALNKNASEQS